MAFIVEYNLTPLLSVICLKPQFIREGVAAHASWIHKQTGCNNYCSDFCSHTVSVFLNKHQTICVFTHIFSPKVRDNEGPVSINHRTGPSFTSQSNSNKSLEKNCFLLDFIVISLIPISIIWLRYYPPRLLQITVLEFISTLWNQASAFYQHVGPLFFFFFLLQTEWVHMQEMASQRSSCLLSIWPSVAVWSRRGRHLFFVCVFVWGFSIFKCSPPFSEAQNFTIWWYIHYWHDICQYNFKYKFLILGNHF